MLKIFINDEGYYCACSCKKNKTMKQCLPEKKKQQTEDYIISGNIGIIFKE